MLNVKKTLTKLSEAIKARPLIEIDWDSPNVQTETRGGANPFTVNSDGWLCGWFNNIGATTYGIYLQINGKEVAAIASNTGANNTAAVGVPVKRGDTVNVRIVASAQNYSLSIFPYVGGVIRTLKNVISNLYREGVAVC